MAPAVSTLSDPIRLAYEDVLKSDFSFLTCTAEELSRLKFVCAKLDGDGDSPSKIPNGTARGVYCTPAGKKLIISLIGILDEKNSRTWAYGNLDKRFRPSAKKLKDCKFIVALKYPPFGPDHPDVKYANGVINELARISDLQKKASSLMMPPDRVTNAARFVKTNNVVDGYMALTLGKVFLSAVSEVSADEFLAQSPTKSPAKEDDSPKPIVDDPEGWVKSIVGENELMHNDQLPIFFEDGTRVGRTGEELSRELTDGRWIRADCEFVMWSMSDDAGTSRTYQLAVQKMVVLPRLPGTEPPKGTEKIEGPGLSYAPMNMADYKPMSEADKAKESEESEGSEATLSSGKPSPEKRKVDDAGDRGNAKKLRPQ